MAGASLLALLDDIASVLDDVALMTKIAAKKTAGGVGGSERLTKKQTDFSTIGAGNQLDCAWYDYTVADAGRCLSVF